MDIPMKPGAICHAPVAPLPGAAWRLATPFELALAGMAPAFRDEVSGRIYTPDAEGRRWLLDGSGEVA